MRPMYRPTVSESVWPSDKTPVLDRVGQSLRPNECAVAAAAKEEPWEIRVARAVL
jgi:hypothetical protein